MTIDFLKQQLAAQSQRLHHALQVQHAAQEKIRAGKRELADAQLDIAGAQDVIAATRAYLQKVEESDRELAARHAEELHLLRDTHAREMADLRAKLNPEVAELDEAIGGGGRLGVPDGEPGKQRGKGE